jgi:hypothetical protein
MLAKTKLVMHKAIILGATEDGVNAAKAFFTRGICPVIIESSGAISARSSYSAALRPSFCVADLSVVAELHFHQLVRAIYFVRNELCSIHTVNNITGESTLFAADYFYFSAPLDEMVTAMNHVPGFSFLPKGQFTNLVAEINS